MTDITIPTPVGTFAIFADTHSYGLQHPKADGTLATKVSKGRVSRGGAITYHGSIKQAINTLVRVVGRRKLEGMDDAGDIFAFVRELVELGESLEPLASTGGARGTQGVVGGHGGLGRGIGG